MTGIDARTTVPTSSALVRVTAVAAPLLLLLYGLLRLVDGLDGDRGNGPAWDVGHTFFLFGILGFAGLIVGLRRVLLATAVRRPAVTNAGTVLGLLGAAAFVWVILGDLFEGPFDDVADPVLIGGPVLFQVGLLTLLVQATTVRPRRLPPWGVPMVLLGFVAIAANLDLLPVAAALILAGLAPLAGRAADD